MSETKVDAELCRKLAAECREDDVRMTLAPWALDEEIAVVFGNVDEAEGVEVACLGEEADNYDGDGPGIVRIRNNLPAIAAQLTAAADLAERQALSTPSIHGSTIHEIVAERDALRAQLAEYRTVADRLADVAVGASESPDLALAEYRRLAAGDHASAQPALTEKRAREAVRAAAADEFGL